MEPELIGQVLEDFQSISGRQEKFKLGDVTLVANLFKNPVGLNQMLDLLLMEEENYQLVMILNNAPADGEDVSWLAQADLEKLASHCPHEILLAGSQRRALHDRLQASNTKVPIREFDNYPELIQAIKANPSHLSHVLFNYTAMLEFKKEIA